MSSVTNPQPDPPAADELVAYLDGELPPEESRLVENRLATDESYRQQLHELDRAWDALDALPTATVDDGFARTTIELACVAAEADLSEHTAVARAAKRSRLKWLAASGIAAIAIGFLGGHLLIPNRNSALLSDLPAIQQLNVLKSVDSVEFLRQLSAAVPLEQLMNDKPAFSRGLADLKQANSKSLEARREWIEGLQPDQKAVLEERAHTFDDLGPSSEEQQRMRRVMDDIRKDPDAAKLQETLIAYGQWLSRKSGGWQEQLREDLQDEPAEKQADIVRRRIARDNEQAYLHLSQDDAEKLRSEIIQLAKEKRPEYMEKMRQGRKPDRMFNFEGPPARQDAMIVVSELFKGNKRDETEKRLISKLSSTAQTHWEGLSRRQQGFGKARQLMVWIQDAMKLKPNDATLAQFFTSDDVSPEVRQMLLDEPREKMKADLERMYIRSMLGIENPGQLFGEMGEQGRMQRGPGGAGQPRRPDGGRPDSPRPGEQRRRFNPNRPPGPGPGGPNQRRPDGSPPNQPPTDKKQAI